MADSIELVREGQNSIRLPIRALHLPDPKSESDSEKVSRKGAILTPNSIDYLVADESDAATGLVCEIPQRDANLADVLVPEHDALMVQIES